MKNIGVLALQGDYLEHFNILKTIKNIKPVLVKKAADLKDLHGLIIPGGESTTIGKLLKEHKLKAPIKKEVKKGMGVFGTCAGCILMAKQVDSEYSLKLMDIKAKRNAYGRQINSFMAPLTSSVFKNLTGIFIRAPKITKVLSPQIKILAKYKKNPVLVRQNNLLCSTFHPELTDHKQLYKYFIHNCC